VVPPTNGTSNNGHATTIVSPKATEDGRKLTFKDEEEEDCNASYAFSESSHTASPTAAAATRRYTPTPMFCLLKGLSRKESAFSLDSWIALSLTLDGRDKLTKLFQYIARVLAWWLAGNPNAERFKALKESLTQSRKAYRLGRSLIEYQKLRTAGLVETFVWYLRRTISEGDDGQPAPRPVLKHRVSSNIGWGPSSYIPREDEMTESGRRSFYRSLSNAAYRKMYRPVVSRLTSSFLGDGGKSRADGPLWQIVGSAIKLVGLMGFWASDNVAFLTSSGLFDNFQTDQASRQEWRKNVQKRAGEIANQSYFAGAVAGLLVNLKAYVDFRIGTLQRLQKTLDDELEEEELFNRRLATVDLMEKAKEKEFNLFVALLKSCCDVMVFSNNPGVDLWMKYRGAKMHEGIHCVGGLLSASAVLYNNFPNKK